MSALTPGADLAWKLAAAEAANAGHSQIENALLLVGILSLEKVGGETAEITLPPEVLRAVEDEARRVGEVLERCGVEASRLRRLLRERLGKGAHDHHGRAVGRSPGCKETFYRAAMLSGPAGVSSLDLLAALGEAPDALVARAVREAGGRVERLRDEARRTARERRAAQPEAVPLTGAVTSSSTPHLDRCGRDLTALAAGGELGPVIGRRAELLHVLQTLARASKNNPVLVGEPGVGKTAIVEALALRAAEGKDPAVLGGKRIVELSLRALLAGTTERGASKEQAARVLAEAREHPEVLLFVDARLAAAGAEETKGAADVAELFRPAIARGEVRVIGAATAAEYHEHVESDPALEPRCEKVLVAEPSREEALELLHGLRPRWERRQQLRIDDQALQAAVDLSVRFDPDHNLPRKALDLVTKAAARAREGPGPSPADAVTERAVVEVVAGTAGLPLELVEEGLGGRLPPRVAELEGFLRERIIGLVDAIARLCHRLRLAHAEAREEERPLATLLFLGPPGVGKAETARLSASFLLGKESALLRFDMSDYAGEDGLARLVGSPPGGPGREDGQLVARLRTTPRAVVLLDAVEKAHPGVLDRLRHVFETGRLTDGRGRSAGTRRAVFILTSSAGRLIPELASRIDETIAFRALGPEDAARILRPRLRALCETVEREHGIRLEVDAEAEAFIARTGYSPASGVRALRRIVERLVEAPLSSLILDGKIRKYPAWHVAYDEGGIYVVPRS
ncbi:MAG TPA: ATP-dependent Clp protease ATP-binding subunit [Vicinamibacteria bacterium]|nr:ATP-dependent Clp protease ATP-binding subunit [Vicinamibacteria bacterium]